MATRTKTVRGGYDERFHESLVWDNSRSRCKEVSAQTVLTMISSPALPAGVIRVDKASWGPNFFFCRLFNEVLDRSSISTATRIERLCS